MSNENENQNQNQNAQQVQIALDPQVAGGVYANLAAINHSPSEFIVDFIQRLPGCFKVASRIILTPENAKSLLAALHENVANYEAQFGEIKLPAAPQAQGDTIAPFGNGKGEA